MSDTPKVYEAIAAITAAMSKTGIAKDRRNAQQGFSFRGIDDVYNNLASLLAEHRLCIIPRCTSREVTERETKQGGTLFSVTVGVDFDLVSAVDGSKHTASMYGEAMDSGDKATNKAMSAAYKYLALELFCIPTEGDNDADSTTHEPAAHAVRLPGGPTNFGGHGGKLLADVPNEHLAAACKYFTDKDARKNAAMIAAIEAELKRRPVAA